jgi:hypothetical protein
MCQRKIEVEASFDLEKWWTGLQGYLESQGQSKTPKSQNDQESSTERTTAPLSLSLEMWNKTANEAMMESPFLQRMMAMNEESQSRRGDWVRFWDRADEIKGHKHEGWRTEKVAYTRASSESGWNYKAGWGFHKDGYGPEDGGKRPGTWLRDTVPTVEELIIGAPKEMVGNKLGSYIIALSYSVPDGVWADSVVNACRYWFVKYGETLSCEWCPGTDKWKWKYGFGAEKGILTREKISLALRTAPEHYLLAVGSDRLAGQMMEALENGKMFDGKESIDDLYQDHGSLKGLADDDNPQYITEEEQDMSKKLYEVFIVNINDADDIEVTQVVADSEDKAKMKAWAEMEVSPDALTPPNVDDYDFFTVDIGRVRESCCKPDSCTA